MKIEVSVPLFFCFVLFAALAPANAEDLTIYVVPAITNDRILPNTSIYYGYASDQLSVVASPGEYEPVSFVVRANEDITSMDVEATDLTGPGTISSGNIDIRVVKCWYQGNKLSRPTQFPLLPELLLKDDALIRIEDGEAYLKLTTGGELWITDPTPPDNVSDLYRDRTIDEVPVQDSDTLQPLDIPAGTNKQFWITLHPPDDVIPGVYTGTIDLRTPTGGLIGQVQLNLEVPPIDLSEPYLTYTLYYTGRLYEDWPDGSISDRKKSEDQLRAEMENMVAHGLTNIGVYQGMSSLTLLDRYLTIKDEAGMDNSTLYYLGRSINYDDLDVLKTKLQEVMDFVAPYGTNECYFYGQDETPMDNPETRAQIAAAHEIGAKVFNAQGKEYAMAIADALDLATCAHTPEQYISDEYHSYGNKVFSYANPQVGMEEPESYRRNYGLVLWQEDYDGAMDFAYQYGCRNPYSDMGWTYRGDEEECFFKWGTEYTGFDLYKCEEAQPDTWRWVLQSAYDQQCLNCSQYTPQGSLKCAATHSLRERCHWHEDACHSCADYTSESECLEPGCEWYEGSCYTYPPSTDTSCDYDSQSGCEANDCYWFDGFCHINDRIPCGFSVTKYKQHIFAYPTINGVIDTVQWEGWREGVDDVRYLTTLLQAIEEATGQGKDTSFIEDWLDNLKTSDLNTQDLDAIRSNMINAILFLHGDVPSYCGNGIVEEGEDCEGNDLNGKTCQDLGYTGGTLACTDSCSFNKCGCTPSSISITFVPPTDSDGAVVSRDWTEINTAITSECVVSGFIDWNHSLIGYWDFNENSGSTANDKSTYLNHGSFQENPQWAAGKLGSALEFSGGVGYVDCGNTPSLNITDKLSIDAWYKTTYTGTHAYLVDKLADGWGWDTGYGIFMSEGKPKLILGYDSSGGGDTTDYAGFTIASDESFNGEWHHIVFTAESNGKVRGYFDGNLYREWDFSHSIKPNDRHFYISTIRQSFQGSIDEVRIYNRILSYEEVKSAYNSKTFSLSPSFEALYDGTYQYYAYTTDSNGLSDQTETRTLIVDSTINTPPSLGSPSPANGATGQTLSLTWSIPISDSEGDSFDWIISCDNGQSNSANGDSSGTKSLSLSSLDYSMAYTVSVGAIDRSGSGSWTNRTFSFTTKSESQNGDENGDNGNGIPPVTPPTSKYNITYNLSEVSEQDIKEAIETKEGIQEALLVAGFDVEDSEVVSGIAGVTKSAYDNCFVNMWIVHPDAFSSEITVKVYCDGSVSMESVVVFVEIPKSFSSSSDGVIVTADPEANIVVVESDPVYSFEHDGLTLGTATYTFYTSDYPNMNDVVSAWKQPWFFIGKISEEAPTECGNSIKEEGEECDGDAPSGYRCVNCKLELSPGPQCVDDMVCSAEEQLIGGCRDCEASPIVLPNEFVPAFLWVRASAGTLLLLGAIVLLGAVAHLWMKRHEHKTKKKP